MKATLPLLFTCAVVLAAGPSARAASFVVNPSFENNYNATFPSYGAIDSWTATGGEGVNESNGPFHNANTPIPDRDRVAFLQGSQKLTQLISGLTPGKQYWIQFYYDARNCCGGAIDLKVEFTDTNGTAVLDTVPSVPAATNYFFRSVAFTPKSQSGTLAFETVSQGDATVDLDAVTMVQRDAGNVPVRNPSFEASGPPTASTGNPPAADSGELVAPASLAGWEATGQYGISLVGGVYADNGAIPDQDLVAFVQGPGSLSQTLSGLTTGAVYQVSLAYNAQSAGGAKPHLQVQIDSKVLYEADVAPVGGTSPYHTKTVSFTATNTSATLTLAQTAASGTLLLDDIRVTGQVQTILPLQFSPQLATLAPTQPQTVQVIVPAQLLASQAADLTFSMANSNVAKLVNADTNGQITLHFAQGSTNVQTLQIQGLATGSTKLQVNTTAPLTVPALVSITVVSSFVRNPSFEDSPLPASPGYGPIAGWTGGSGLNDATGPFVDNGIIPDRKQVAFLQGSTSLSQPIFELKPGKNYWLQFRYNARAFGNTAVDLQVKLGGNLLAAITNITAVGATVGDNPWNFTNLVFVPTNATAVLEFDSKPTVAGADATLLLDAVNMVQRNTNEILIENPSFEASGNPSGVGYAGPIDGWAGGSGLNVGAIPEGPFTDNGLAPDQDEVAFIQGSLSLSQTINGLVAGKTYTLFYSVNKRSCCGGSTLTYDVTFGDLQLLMGQEIDAAGDDNPYLVQFLTFTNDAPSGLLTFTAHPAGDATLLLDDIHLVPGVVSPTGPQLTITRLANGDLQLSWPTSAAGYNLEETSTLPKSWAASAATVTVQGANNVAEITPSGGAKYYRLAK